MSDLNDNHSVASTTITSKQPMITEKSKTLIIEEEKKTKAAEEAKKAKAAEEEKKAKAAEEAKKAKVTEEAKKIKAAEEAKKSDSLSGTNSLSSVRIYNTTNASQSNTLPDTKAPVAEKKEVNKNEEKSVLNEKKSNEPDKTLTTPVKDKEKEESNYTPNAFYGSSAERSKSILM